MDGITPTIEQAVRTEKVGDKIVPVLIWPDGSRIHLMPCAIEGQDPAKQLRHWLGAWCAHTVFAKHKQVPGPPDPPRPEKRREWA